MRVEHSPYHFSSRLICSLSYLKTHHHKTGGELVSYSVFLFSLGNPRRQGLKGLDLFFTIGAAADKRSSKPSQKPRLSRLNYPPSCFKGSHHSKTGAKTHFFLFFSWKPLYPPRQTNRDDGLHRASSWRQLVKRRDSHVAEDQQQAVKEAEELINKQGEDLIRFNVRGGRKEGQQTAVVAPSLGPSASSRFSCPFALVWASSVAIAQRQSNVLRGG